MKPHLYSVLPKAESCRGLEVCGSFPLRKKEKCMSRTSCVVVSLALMSLLFCGVFSVGAGQEDPNLSGTVTITATSAAVGVGWTWGSGMLTLLNGKEYRFKISGLDVIAVGYKQASAVGKVYNLKKVSDFAGTYVSGTAAGTIGGGAGITTMRNEHGVVMNLTSVSEGADLRLAVSGMKVTLVKGK
jgi:hypothetical protein